MSEPAEDDPTHALDDFIRRMRQPAPPPAPDLSDLAARLHPGPDPVRPDAGDAARPRGGVLRSGQRWSADEVQDVPVVEWPSVDLAAEQRLSSQAPTLDLPQVADTAPPAPDQLDDATRQASRLAAAHGQALATGSAAWQPDARALQRRAARDPRLVGRWQAGAWTGALRQVAESATEFITTPTGPAVQTYPPHQLLLLWPPQGPQQAPPGRWPAQAQLLALPADQAADAALALVPGDAPLWLNADLQSVDWVLGAEILLHHLDTLRPFQVDALRGFIADEREAVFARLNTGYAQAAPGGPVVARKP